MSLRLKGPLSASGAGRVEMFYHGYWGTICDGRWEFRDAKVVCRQLGYPNAVRALQKNEFPPGSGQIWLDHVACTGEEENITSCSHNSRNIYYCSHDQDVGVECSTTGQYLKLVMPYNKNCKDACLRNNSDSQITMWSTEKLIMDFWSFVLTHHSV